MHIDSFFSDLKSNSLPELIAEYNRILRLAQNRTRAFQDNNKNCYWFAVERLKRLNPDIDFSAGNGARIGKVKLKKTYP